MKLPSLFRIFGKKAVKRPAKRPVKKSSRKGESELAVQLELVVSKKREAERKAAELQREIDGIPLKLKQLEEAEKRRMRERAERTPTIQGLGRPVQRLHTVAEGVGLTRAQRRALRNRFLILSVALAVVLFFLWRAVR